MKKVLIIAYYFPPLGGAGVQRTLRFVKNLPKYDWQPTVVSVSNNNYYIKDYSLLSKINDDVEILRFQGFEFLNYYHKAKKYGLHKFISLLDKITALPDSQVFWYRKIIKRLPNILDINNFDVIYATFGPGSNLLVGLWLAKHFKKPLVVDFRDEWANSPQVKSRMQLRIKKPLYKMLEDKCIRDSKKVICLNTVMRGNFIKNYPDEIPDKFTIIPNGYDEDDFSGFNNFYEDKVHKGMLNFLYTGSFYGPQNPEIFLHGLNKFINSNPSVKNEIVFNFIGNVREPKFLQMIEALKLENIINIHPYVEHKELINYIRNADLLLLIIANMPGSEEIYTGKLFEYLASGKPIFAMVPPNGVAAQLIKNTNSGFVVDNINPRNVSALLNKVYLMWKNNKLKIHQEKEKIKKFSGSVLTEKLVNIFDEVI